MSEHEVSAPPSPPPPRSPAPSAAILPPAPESVADRSLRIGLANRREIGDAPNPLTGYHGSGIWRMLGEIRVDLTRVLTWVETESASRGERGGWASRVGWIVVQTIVTAGVLAALAYASGFRHGP